MQAKRSGAFNPIIFNLLQFISLHLSIEAAGTLAIAMAQVLPQLHLSNPLWVQKNVRWVGALELNFNICSPFFPFQMTVTAPSEEAPEYTHKHND